jgi:hypothetical protein
MKLKVSFDFLDPYIKQQIVKGAKVYDQDKNRKGLNYLIHKSRNEEYKASDALQSMRLEPYQAPVLDKFVSKPLEIRQDPNELQVKAKVWSKQGFSGPSSFNEQPKPAHSFVSQVIYQPKTQSLKSDKDIAKETFAQGLFGGVGEQPRLLRPQPVINNPTVFNSPSQVPKKEPENLLDF